MSGALTHNQERSLYDSDREAWFRYVEPGIAQAWRRSPESYRREVWPLFSEGMRALVKRALAEFDALKAQEDVT